MKAKTVIDLDADTSQLTDAHPPVTFVPGKKKGKPKAIFPKGSEFTGDQALAMCRRGQASPSDQECSDALGFTESQIKSVQLDYKMDAMGVNSKEDRALFRAGVIEGYDSKLNYIPGPNWEAYQKAKEQSAEDDV
jgi:hypothetical protein